MNTVSENLYDEVSANGQRWSYMAGRLAGALDLAIERLEASQPEPESATHRVIIQCKESLKSFEKLLNTQQGERRLAGTVEACS